MKSIEKIMVKDTLHILLVAFMILDLKNKSRTPIIVVNTNIYHMPAPKLTTTNKVLKVIQFSIE